MTLVILTGEIDISVGSAFAICSVAAGRAGQSRAADAARRRRRRALVGALLGAVNGALVAYLRIPSIVVTLATMIALRDGLRWATQGAWVQDLPAGFQWLGLTQARIPFVVGAGRGRCLMVAIAWGAAATWPPAAPSTPPARTRTPRGSPGSHVAA